VNPCVVSYQFFPFTNPINMNNQTFDSEFTALLASFEAIAKIGSQLKRQFTLGRIASWHGLTKAECRRLFDLYLIERVSVR